ncbi:hypothetical protein [Cryobacterium sp. Y50]|uniref:hypothetical protein n=1 Tax=Cryobacterium sp. Y50 TaxID=2048286 RepID=UPI000CE4F3A6|nr:hypothetical protein [Cryobacterium sp. Y50]
MYGTPPPIGPYRTYQVPIIDLTGLNLTALSEADAYAPASTIREDTDPRTRWTELIDTAGIHLSTH